jgi:NADH-quinone oxidoreductase subunit H
MTNPVTWTLLTVGGILLVVIWVLLSLAFLVLADRKIWAGVQMRKGPNVVGPFGLLQSFADFLKFVLKEIVIPAGADKVVFLLAPLLSLILAFAGWAVVPFAPGWVVSNLNVGILYLLAMSSLGVYGIIMGGWASNSKYPFLGALRSAAQMVSYEAALGMNVVTVLLVCNSLSTRAIVDAQGGSFFHWNLIKTGLIPFVLFLIAATAELNRPPFDVVEAESELVGGFHTEYSSIRFALFFLSEYLNTITQSAIIVTLFLGGPAGWVPPVAHFRWVFPIMWFVGKTVAFAFAYIWFRASLPRFRYDQVMELGWKRLIPLSLGWMLVVAGFLVSRSWGFCTLAVVILSSLLLSRAFELGEARSEGPESVLPSVAQRPIPGHVIRELLDGHNAERGTDGGLD